MAAPAKFLFDIDFAAGAERERTVPLSEHAGKLAEAETAAHRRGYAEGQHDAEVETGRRIAATLERIAAGIDRASSALKAIEALAPPASTRWRRLSASQTSIRSSSTSPKAEPPTYRMSRSPRRS